MPNVFSFALNRGARSVEVPPKNVDGRRRPGRRGAVVGLAALATMVLASIVVPLVSSYGPDALVAAPFAPPSLAHPFGTDTIGRDVLVRTFVAARLDYAVAFVGVGVPLVIGTIVGVLATLSGRVAERALMRVTDAVIAFPYVVLVLALALAFGAGRAFWIVPAGIPALLLSIWLVGWALYARLARAQTRVVRTQDYVLAARLLGYSRVRIVMRHILPIVASAALTYAVADSILTIVLIGSLPFLGAGVQPPAPEWGAMMYEGQSYLANAWWISVFPGLAMVGSGLALSALGDRVVRREEMSG